MSVYDEELTLTDEHEPDRWQEIREIQKRHIDFYKLLGAVILVGLGVLIGRSLNPADTQSIAAQVMGFR